VICLCSGQNLSLSRTDDLADAKTYHSPTTASQSKNILSKEYIIASEDDDERLKKCTVRITGMTCGSCVANIERRLHMLKGECFASTNTLYCEALLISSWCVWPLKSK